MRTPVSDPMKIGPYKIVGRLGSGGMGWVYLGRSPSGREVAVKVARPELAAEPEFRERFAREVAAARVVSGAYTAAVVDADPEAELPWLATLYVPGPSLAEAVRADGPLPEDQVRRLGAGLVEALQAIHAAHVIHRDLKPANVLLASDGPRVIDFGISRVDGAPGLTRVGIVVGTPSFMSPEQIRGAQVGPPSDVFALGGVLVYALTGRPPHGSGKGCGWRSYAGSRDSTACRSDCGRSSLAVWPSGPRTGPDSTRSCGSWWATPPPPWSRPGRRPRWRGPSRCGTRS
ncbi:serine/threonine-protein kinase [Streptomyces ipomoeae]|uniref:serine/threonine-protein kinase n=1 Tax=Streptomyces ipomoeae TaxID=103232 RepID=UPI002852E372|nr:serine/threonine-protein kinase [Streptomyces ipomoeae]